MSARLSREGWEELKPFDTPEDIPFLPVVDKEEWESYYVPKLHSAGAIPRKDMKDGQVYLGEHRNTTIARWNEEKGLFEYRRVKFNTSFIDTTEHFETHSTFAVFVPIKELPPESF